VKPALAGLFLALALVFPAAASEATPFAVEVESRPIASFRRGSGETRFGALDYVGGFEMRASAPVFGQLSALRFLAPGGDFVGVADHGYWFSGRIRRDAAGVPLGVEGFSMQAMVDRAGRVLGDKVLADAEGLEVADGVATVSFEREARLSEYLLGPDAGLPVAGAGRDLDFVIPRRELRFNRGIETVVRAPQDGPLRGARIVVAERSIDANGDIFAAIVEGPGRGVFKVRRSGDFDVTDGAFLPDGDLILLERRYRPPFSVGMRLRRIAAATLKPGALVDGEVLIEAGLSAHIDNMEGLDVWRREDGTTILSLISDDNQSFLQRTLYLEFALRERE
jgi:hypothetical protein